jgi:hypothetical protein
MLCCRGRRCYCAIVSAVKYAGLGVLDQHRMQSCSSVRIQTFSQRAVPTLFHRQASLGPCIYAPEPSSDTLKYSFQFRLYG